MGAVDIVGRAAVFGQDHRLVRANAHGGDVFQLHVEPQQGRIGRADNVLDQREVALRGDLCKEARLEALDEDRDAGFAQAPASDRVEDRVHHVEAGG